MCVYPGENQMDGNGWENLLLWSEFHSFCDHSTLPNILYNGFPNSNSSSSSSFFLLKSQFTCLHTVDDAPWIACVLDLIRLPFTL